jgi:hypothetical protein
MLDVETDRGPRVPALIAAGYQSYAILTLSVATVFGLLLTVASHRELDG